jgi:hypothetical protein
MGDKAAGLVEEAQTLRGRRNTLRMMAYKKLKAQLRFEFLERSRKRRLSHAQVLCRLGK